MNNIKTKCITCNKELDSKEMIRFGKWFRCEDCFKLMQQRMSISKKTKIIELIKEKKIIDEPEKWSEFIKAMQSKSN